MREGVSYPALYQELAARKTHDKSISILQGRAVGGGTTVNWTTCFRTPEKTLAYWRDKFGLEFDLDQHFKAAEEFISVTEWDVPPNQNNSVLELGMHRLGRDFGRIKRNVRGCYNLGYCGVGCPTGAKQSQLVTGIPKALSHGAILATRFRALYLKHHKGRVQYLEAINMPGLGNTTGEIRLNIFAEHFIVAAGAIGTPALLLRSQVEDASG